MILVTWRLRGSLRHKPRCASAMAVDRLLDRAPGERLVLGDARFAAAVRDTLERGTYWGLYDLRAWVLHHNHVHVLMEPHTGTVRIAETLMDASELSAARRFWERESYERLIRNSLEEKEAVDFVEQHPVRLGLVERAEDWEWSSAHPGPEDSRGCSRVRMPVANSCDRAMALV